LNVAINFLADIAETVGYSAVNTARSALSCIIQLPNGKSFGKHVLVKRLLKGVFEQKPALPRYSAIWDVNIVLQYLKQYPSYDKISLKEITLKLTALLAILTGQRCQTLHLLDITNMQLLDDKCLFYIAQPVKQSTPNRHLKPIELLTYEDEQLCVIMCIKTYLTMTKHLRKPNVSSLLISFNKPHNAVNKDTISRWVKTVLKGAGINIKAYGAHSTRAAATSAAKVKGLSISRIMNSAGWSNDKTFAKFYNLPVDNNLKMENFGNTVLKNV